MLKSVKRPDGETVSFEYDPLGCRISKTYKDRTTRWVWDGNVPLHEWTDEEDITTWVFEEGSFVPCAKLQNRESYSIITDYLGTPTHAFDSNGAKIWERELDIYGRIRNGSSNFVPFLFQGQYWDEETDLCYNRFRYYSPDTGAYISQDPIGLAGNNPTLYGYVFDTNTQIDILGLNLTITVLGHYPAYIELAKKTNARVFSLPDTVWRNMSEAEIWEANKKFLDRTYMKEHDVLLATPFDKARPGSYFEKELDYMINDKGYALSSDGEKLIHPNNLH